MSRRLHIIYIPGFGGNYDTARRALLRCWRIFGVSTEQVAMRWNSAESYDKKCARIIVSIDKAADKRIVVIGESAGASMALAVYAKRPNDLYKVMTICGKNNNPESVSPALYAQHVAFREAMQAAERAVTKLTSNERRQFVSFYPIYDEIIPFKEATIPDCKVMRLMSAGHFLTIFLALTLFSGYIVHVAKR